MNKHLSLLGGLPLLLLDVSAAGAAPVLPDATGSASEGGDQEQFFPPGFYSGQTTFAGRPVGVSGSNAFSSASADIGVAPWPSLNLHASVAAGGDAGASAGLAYYIEVFNPNASLSSIPVLVSGRAITSGYETSGSERFQGNIELQSPDDPFRMPLYGTDVCGGDDERICFSIPLLPDSFDETDTVSVPVNEIISVSLFADIDISSCYSTTANPQFNCTTLGPGSLDMLVTAGLEIDPSFAALNPGYELLISPNLDADMPVDEPSTLPLFGAGAAGLVLLSRRRQTFNNNVAEAP